MREQVEDFGKDFHCGSESYFYAEGEQTHKEGAFDFGPLHLELSHDKIKTLQLVSTSMCCVRRFRGCSVFPKPIRPKGIIDRMAYVAPVLRSGLQ